MSDVTAHLDLHSRTGSQELIHGNRTVFKKCNGKATAGYNQAVLGWRRYNAKLALVRVVMTQG